MERGASLSEVQREWPIGGGAGGLEAGGGIESVASRGRIMTRGMETKAMLVNPWNYWSAATRETVRLELAKLADEIEMDAAEMSWSEYPVTRQRLEDTMRAMRDLLDLVEGGMGEAVGMGEEAAP